MRRLACVLGLALAACGDPLVESSYVGTPQLTVRGVVQQVSDMRIPAMHGPLALSVFWIGTGTTATPPLEQEARLDSGLGEYTMTMFDAPPAEARRFSTLTPGVELAIGVLALYADQDTSGTLALDRDLLLGASAQHVVVFTSADVPGDSRAGRLVGALRAGYHVLVHDRRSACRFYAAQACTAEGALLPAGEAPSVTLTLWDTPDLVVVPAPALDAGSVWGVAP